jgi:transposase
MPPVDRNHPKRAKSSESSYSLMEFMRDWPNDEACLDYLWRSRHAPDGENAYCPRCGQVRRFRRYHGKRARHVWTCTSCTQQLSPTVGTIFHKSSTSLHLWFYALYLMTSTRCGISAKQLERELGVTYKTAWRMFNLIRNRLMVQDYQGPLSGEVEADETFVGGKLRESERRKLRAQGIVNRGPATKPRVTVMGIVERKGQVRAMVIPSSRGYQVRMQVREHVAPGSTVYTDDWGGYHGLAGGTYTHFRINHSQRIYVSGRVHTQTVEGFFALVKNAIRGVHHGVSKRWLQGYLNEYVWRWNHREDDDTRAMFRLLLERAAMTS